MTLVAGGVYTLDMDRDEILRINKRLSTCQAAYLDALAHRNIQIVDARDRGFTLRQIATVVGLSVETVRKISHKEESR